MRTRKCYTTEELADYSVGKGRKGWRLGVEEHFSTCSSCSKELVALENVDELLNKMQQDKAPDLWRVIAPKLEPRKSLWAFPALQVRSRAIAAAAAAVAIVAGVVVLQEPIRQSSSQVSAVDIEHVDTHITMTWGDPFADAASLAVISSGLDEGQTE